MKRRFYGLTVIWSIGLDRPSGGLFTCMGDGFFLFPLGMLLVWKNPARQQSLVITIVLAALALNISKHVIDATRPLGILGEALGYGSRARCQKPEHASGHTGTTVVLTGLALLFSGKRVATAAIVLAALTGLSRIAVGAHWPVDVVAGAWIGLVCSALGAMISARFNAGIAIRSFYIFLGFIPAFLLPVYNNGFQGIALVRYSQHLLAALSLFWLLQS